MSMKQRSTMRAVSQKQKARAAVMSTIDEILAEIPTAALLDV